MKKLEIILLGMVVVIVLLMLARIQMDKGRERFAGEEHVRMEKKYGDVYSL